MKTKFIRWAGVAVLGTLIIIWGTLEGPKGYLFSPLQADVYGYRPFSLRNSFEAVKSLGSNGTMFFKNMKINGLALPLEITTSDRNPKELIESMERPSDSSVSGCPVPAFAWIGSGSGENSYGVFALRVPGDSKTLVCRTEVNKNELDRFMRVVGDGDRYPAELPRYPGTEYRFVIENDIAGSRSWIIDGRSPGTDQEVRVFWQQALKKNGWHLPAETETLLPELLYAEKDDGECYILLETERTGFCEITISYIRRN